MSKTINLAAKALVTDRRYRPQAVKARKGKGSYSRKNSKHGD
jgi:stalled ribosome alternative rescue factor ArfA